MTPQEKKVFGKLFAKTELATQKIELALTDDFDKLFNKGNDDNETIGKSLIDNLSKAEASYKQNIQILQNAKKISEDLISKAKDLGIDLPTATLNRIKSVDLLIKENQTYLSKISQMYSMF
jgi:hypothetical protein